MRYFPIAVIAAAMFSLILVAALNGSHQPETEECFENGPCLPVVEQTGFIRPADEAVKKPKPNLIKKVRAAQRETKRLQIAGRFEITKISKPIAQVKKKNRLGKLRYWERQLRRVTRAHYLAPPPWGALARCETGAAWGYNGRVIYDGGLQFHPNTWTSYVLRGFPSFAYLATPRQQILVAIRVQAAQGWGAWPACARKLGLL